MTNNCPFTLPDGATAEVTQHRGGPRIVVTFANGRGASIIRNDMSYGHEHGLWELGVLDHTGALDYDTPITDGVVGYLDEQSVDDLLVRIDNLS